MVNTYVKSCWTFYKVDMWVNGKYISKKHPLYINQVRYKSFGDAAFSALQKDKQIKEGLRVRYP